MAVVERNDADCEVPTVTEEEREDSATGCGTIPPRRCAIIYIVSGQVSGVSARNLHGRHICHEGRLI